jgi:hypothetical protein
MRSPGGRATFLAAAAMVMFSATPALAATYCVNAPGCKGTSEPSVQQALNVAGATAGADIIRVGAGTYHGPFTDAAGNVVTLIGAGDRTVFDNPSGSTAGSPTSTVQVSEPTSKLSSVAVVVPPGTSGIGIQSTGKIDHVLVRDVPSDAADTGVSVIAGSLSHSRIVLAGTTSGGANPMGILAGGFIQDDLVHMLHAGARGIEMSSIVPAEGRQLTLVGPGDAATSPTDGASRGVSVDPLFLEMSSTTTIQLDGVVVSGFAHALAANGSQVSNLNCQFPPCMPPFYDVVATIDVSYSDFNPANDIKGTVDSNINPGKGNLNVNPGFENPSLGDFALRRGSAVIDRGDPAVPQAGPPADSTTDLAGNPRVSDGNGDGRAVVDMGAYEYTNLVPVARISAPARALVGHAVRFDGSSSHDPDGDPLRFSWNFGDGIRSTARNPMHTYSRAGTFTVRLVVTDVLGARSTPADVRIRITPRV